MQSLTDDVINPEPFFSRLFRFDGQNVAFGDQEGPRAQVFDGEAFLAAS